MPKRILQGTVESAANNKTVSVRVERTYRHPLYKKTVRKSTKYSAHDENNVHKVGDKVRIQECRPLSKTKSWVVLSE
ncbi:MAG: 30S ribosomal protein S17 [Rickettsiales bacterium]|nr:MAG: 30S ribosomal protein S17 [Rickettsiales bacterium]